MKKSCVILAIAAPLFLAFLLYIRTSAPWYYVPPDPTKPIVKLTILEESKDQIGIESREESDYFSAFSKKHPRLFRFYWIAYLSR